MAVNLPPPTFGRAPSAKLLGGDQPGALSDWHQLSDLPLLLFAEPSPAPIKHWLWRSGLIDSAQVRLPMTSVSEGLAARIDQEIERTRAGDRTTYDRA
jgi:4-hydroxy-tetrahydrodipicolinate synthase